MTETAPIVFHPSPFSLKTQSFVADPGLTLEQIVRAIPDLPPEIWTHGVVAIGEHEIPRHLWSRVRPKPGSRHLVRICIRLSGGGGGGGKSILGTIAAIALVVAVTAISGGILGPSGALSVSGTLFAAGSTSAALAAAGVSIVGALAINALIPTPSTDSTTETEDDTGESAVGSASIQANTLGAGKPIPFVTGTHRIAPPHIILPWSEGQNDDVYVNTIIALNGPHLLEDVRVNGAPIDDFEEIEYETRDVVNDDTDLTLITTQVFESQVSAELPGHKVNDDATDELQDSTEPSNSYPVWQSARSKRDPDQIWLSILFSNLVFQTDTGTNPAGVPIRIRIRRAGETAWINLPELHAHRERLQPFRGTVKIIFEEAPGTLTRPDQAPSFPPWSYGFFVTNSENGESFDVDSYFDDAATIFAANVGQDDGTILIYLDPDTFPKGTYDVQVQRGYGYDVSDFATATYLLGGSIPYFFTHTPASSPPSIRQEQSKAATQLTFASISSMWDAYPLGEKGMSLIAVKAKNIAINQLTVKATGYAHVWDGEDWNNFEPTKNPAAWFRHLALGGQSVNPTIIESQLDDSELQEWYDFCGDERTLAADFGAQASYLTRGADLTGAVDSKQFTLSMWIYVDENKPTLNFVIDGANGLSNRFRMVVIGDNTFESTASNSSDTLILRAVSKPLTLNAWNHVLYSVDMTDSNSHHLYINDIDALDSVDTFTDDTIDFTTGNFVVGGSSGLSPTHYGQLAEVWFEDGLYTDFSVEANRRKFISANRRPVGLGSDGSTPTGSAPVLYLSNSDGAFQTNKGTGGNFTVGGASLESGFVFDSANAPNRECNAYFSSKKSLGEVLRLVAGCGHASPRVSDKIGAIVEKDRTNETPIALFSQRNSSGLTIKRAFPQNPDGLRVTFANEENDYQAEEIFVYKNPNGSNIEAIDYQGITKEGLARDRAALDLQQLLLRPALYDITTDIQQLYCTKGSLVTLAHDTIRRHTDGARVLKASTSSGNLTGLTLDCDLRLDLIGDATGASLETDRYTKILLHFDGSDASTTFTDSSLSAHSFTASGDAQLDTSDYAFGAASGLFDGTGDWIEASDDDEFALGSNDFTIELWVNIEAVADSNAHICGQGDAAGDTNGRAWLIQRNSSNKIKANIWEGTTQYDLDSISSYTDEINAGWHHIAFSRKGNILYLFIDGVKQSSRVFSGSVNDSEDELGIGRLGGDTALSPFTGRVDEFRFTNGVARYDRDFELPVSAHASPEVEFYSRDAGLTGAADGREFSFSAWIKFTQESVAAIEGSTGPRIFTAATTVGGSGNRQVVFLQDDQFRIVLMNAAGTNILSVSAFSGISAKANQWFHVMASFDLTDTANRHLYIDGVDYLDTVSVYTDDDIDWTLADWSIGALPDGTGELNGSIAELWVDDAYIDLSQEFNRLKFYSANGRPVSLGADGSTPTGASPLVYMSGNDGDFLTNKGAGGGFTENGTPGTDAVFYEDGQFPAGVVIQLQDGTTLTAEIDEEGQTDTVTFASAQAMPSYLSYQGSWAISTAYAVDDVVINDGESYTCVIAHTSSAGDEPGTGASWFSYWEPLLRDCLVASGPFSSVDRRMLVLGITPRDEFTAGLTLIDEGERPFVTANDGADDIYAADGSRIRTPF